MRPLEKRKPTTGHVAGSQDGNRAISKSDNSANGSGHQGNWGKRNPLARWAHRAFESALRRGLVERQPCEECGDPNTEFHHFPDRYHEPLTGKHLCRRCHCAEHVRLRKAGDHA